MAGNIFSLVPPQRNLELADLADALRERIESGEAVAVAYAVINADGTVSTNFVHGPQLMALIGAVHHLAARLERTVDVT